MCVAQLPKVGEQEDSIGKKGEFVEARLLNAGVLSTERAMN